MSQFQYIREQYLEQVLALAHNVVSEYSGDKQPLSIMNQYHWSTGGKRLRAVLPLAVAHALEHDPAPLLPFGAACEMIHNATLVHDDLQDRDTKRRGKPTVWTAFGEPQAINLGDAMFFYALACIQKLETTPEKKCVLVDRVTKSTLRVIAGQENEFKLQTADAPTMADYFTMVEGKTSGLFALPMAGAAFLCETPTHWTETLQQVANHLGVLFQVQDDVLDMYGDKGREQKGSDIGEGKRSLMAVYAMEQGGAEEATLLREILDRPRDETTDKHVEQARSIFESTGALDFALDTIRQRHQAAINTVESLDHGGLRTLVQEACTVFTMPIAELLDSHQSVIEK